VALKNPLLCNSLHKKMPMLLHHVYINAIKKRNIG
jgi:hypothetical protein